MRLFHPFGRAATLVYLLATVIRPVLSVPTKISTANDLTLLDKRVNVLCPFYINGFLLKAYQEFAIVLPIQLTAAHLKASTCLQRALILPDTFSICDPIYHGC